MNVKKFVDNPKALNNIFILDNIGDNMQNHYLQLYSNKDDKKEKSEEIKDEYTEDYLSHVNLFTEHHTNY